MQVPYFSFDLTQIVCGYWNKQSDIKLEARFGKTDCNFHTNVLITFCSSALGKNKVSSLAF